MGLGRGADSQDPGKLPSQARHAAFQPVTTMLGDAIGNALDLPGLVRGENSDDEVVHGAVLLLGEGTV
ncbi:hypothetical protein D3C84_1312130 [compost metagenome]